MGAKKYNEEQKQAWEEAREAWFKFKFGKKDLELKLRHALEKELKELKFDASRKANKALDLGVSNADFRRLISTNWNTIKEFLAIGRE